MGTHIQLATDQLIGSTTSYVFLQLQFVEIISSHHGDRLEQERTI